MNNNVYENYFKSIHVKREEIGVTLTIQVFNCTAFIIKISFDTSVH